jgi:hypothetical protein
MVEGHDISLTAKCEWLPGVEDLIMARTEHARECLGATIPNLLPIAFVSHAMSILNASAVNY